MNEAIRQMLQPYNCLTRADYTNALREILQELALLGLWRTKFFEHAAFYGGTALRILYGLDRFSEDLDFSLLKPNPSFSLKPYGDGLRRELTSFGFEVDFEVREKRARRQIESAFLKTNTLQQLIVIEAHTTALGAQHAHEQLKIKLEVDTDPPPGFATESKPLLVPIPFTVNSYSLPDLFAGKMHAILCRKWKQRVKGRDWYDLVWYLARHPTLRLSHLEQRMRQSGDWHEGRPFTREDLMQALIRRIETLPVNQARDEAARFVRDSDALAIWSQDFFLQIVERIQVV